MKRKSAVVAIGGNSLIKDRFHQTVRDQYIAAGETCWHIASMIQDGWDVAIGHGNGPQVGFILRRSELAAGELHEVPLDVCGADSQGAIGYALTQNLENDFHRLGIDVVIAHPPGFELMPEVLEQAQATAADAGSSITFTHDMDEAFAGADVVYPKSWGRIDAFGGEQSALAESAEFKDWICDARRMSLASPDALYMHCLPADRGTEVTDEVIDGPQSVVYDEAENRMHTGKALCALTMDGYTDAQAAQ